MILFLDLETYSETPIRDGTYRYAESAEVLLFSYAIDDGPVSTWDLTTGDEMPADLQHATDVADEVVAHNAMFDRSVLERSRNLRVPIPLERWRDTMSMALAHSLPGSLAGLCEVLKVPQDQRKIVDDRKLVLLFCRPRPRGPRATRDTHPEQWASFVNYAEHDVTALRGIYARCPKWNYTGHELDLWHLDQRINDRGVCVDTALATAAIDAVAAEQARLKELTHKITGYVKDTSGVESTSRRDQLLEYLLAEHGVLLPDLQRDTLQRRLEDPELPASIRELLAIRLMVTTTSTAKYSSLLRAVSSDGRLRGTLQFCGAPRTGRWAGRTFQPHNLPRPDMKPADIKLGIEALKDGSVDLAYDNVMRVASNALRGCIVAGPGKTLVVADLANIEGRVAAWLGGEAWKLERFREYDAGTGPDLYLVAYARAFGVAPETIDPSTLEGHSKRQIGKVMELMLQYEGGVGAFVTGAASYGIDLDRMADAALPSVPADVLAEATRAWQRAVTASRPTFALSENAWVACDSLKRLWRRAHSGISGAWGLLTDAARNAVARPGVWGSVGPVPARCDGKWLTFCLPSGRLLSYPSPRVSDQGTLSYAGANVYSRKWGRIDTYGGKLFENVVQAVARDVLAHGMLTAERARFDVVMSVHDELITEAPAGDSRRTVERLCELMSSPPPWARGLPLAAKGFADVRYRKD